MSYIHFKTVYNLNYDKVTFDGSSIHLQQLKKLIAEKSKLSKKLDFDLEISNAETNQIYQENDVILKNTRVIVKRVIKSSCTPLRPQSPKIASPITTSTLVTSQSVITLPKATNEDLVPKRKPISPSVSLVNVTELSAPITAPKSVYDSLAPLNIPSKPLIYVEEAKKLEQTETNARLDERAKLESILLNSMTKSPTAESQSRFSAFNKSWQKQMNPINRPIPPGYVCVICKKPGHLKQLCPEAGLIPRPEERPKFPSGIPRTNLRPAQAGDKFAMLGPEGYVVTEIDQEAAKIVKKDRVLFEDEDEGDSVAKSEGQEVKTDEIPKDLKCPFGNHLIKDAVLVPCCGHFVCCDECIRQKILNEEPIVCPNEKCDQEIGPLISITPFHETRKKVQEYLNEMKMKQNIPQTEAKTDVFLDLILSDVNGEAKEGSESPLQDNKISSSEILSQQLIAASNESQRLSPALLPTPPNTPSFEASQLRPLQSSLNYQYRARFLGQKVYSPHHQMYPSGPQVYPFMPRPQFYSQNRPRFIRPPMTGYPDARFYPPITGDMSGTQTFQGVMTESQFYEYQESLKKEKERESKIEKKDDKETVPRSRTRSRERYKRSRSRSRSYFRDKYKSRHRSRSRSRGRTRSRSRSKRKYKRSRSRSQEKKSKKKSRSRSRSVSVKKKKDKRSSKSRSRSTSTSASTESVESEKRKDKKLKHKSKKKKDKK